MITITKIFEFASAHFLPEHEGKCKNIHGHNFSLEITVTGDIHTCGPQKGMIMDFGNLKEIVNSTIINRFDHVVLNSLCENPTAEMMIIDIANILDTQFQKLSVSLVKIKLWETSTSFAEYVKS